MGTILRTGPAGRLGSHRARRESGAVLVELALALLPVSMIAFGTIDLGRAYSLETQLRNAAHAAAAYASAFPTQVAPTPDQSGAGTCADPNNIQYQAANENGPTGSSSLPAGAVMTVIDVTRGTTITGCGPDASAPPVVAAGDTLKVEISAPFGLVTPLVAGAVGSVTVHGTVDVVAQ
ncbi:MAG TPA: TadE/TadG family type IV pilus assembly protein [Acidimicrobiales bacterium]|nr:TadE/TadG family type IV pilus assembly protein [Acidimicrobiales bacterium]